MMPDWLIWIGCFSIRFNHFFRGDMKIKSNQMLVNDEGKIIMGNGRMKILLSIAQTGSINKTAQQLKMAYKTVWSKIKSTEENFGKPVVVADRIQGTRLTQEGEKLLRDYQQLKQRCIAADDLIFNEIFTPEKKPGSE